MHTWCAVDVEHSSVRFLGDMVLNLWDCGGQDVFFESYFEGERDSIFRDVELLIYVLDVKSADKAKDMRLFTTSLQALGERSRGARVFVLLHKMDLVDEAEKETVFNSRAEEIRSLSGGFAPQVFGTSIWDETLYRAWSQIAHSLIPNVTVLERHLDEFAAACGADEVVLFERSTFLVISQATRKAPLDEHRFEKTSNIVKQFKLACAHSHSAFHSMRVGNSKFTAIVDAFTATTYILVVVSDPGVPSGSVALNISIARPHFERVISNTARPVPAAESSLAASYMGSYFEDSVAGASGGGGGGGMGGMGGMGGGGNLEDGDDGSLPLRDA